MRTLITLITGVLSFVATTCWAADERVPVKKIAMVGSNAFELIAYRGCSMPEVLLVQPRAQGGQLVTNTGKVNFCYWGDGVHVYIATEGGSKYILDFDAFTPVY